MIIVFCAAAGFNEKSKQAAGPDINGLLSKIHIQILGQSDTWIATQSSGLTLGSVAERIGVKPVRHYAAHFVSGPPQATNYQLASSRHHGPGTRH